MSLFQQKSSDGVSVTTRFLECEDCECSNVVRTINSILSLGEGDQDWVEQN